ncbi:MAG TPA: DMT family transporter [Segetibacter sp.]
MNTKQKAHAAVLAANIIFAANYGVIKFISPAFIKPFGLNLVRVIVSSILLWLMFALKPSSPGIQQKHFGRFILCAATGVAINQMLFIKGLTMTTSIHAALLILGTPIFITFLAAWLLKETFGWNKVFGLLLGISGAVLLVLIKESTSHGSNVILGDIIILINALSYAFYLVLVRPLMEAYSPIHVLRWVFTIGTFMILPFGYNQFIAADYSSFTADVWLALSFAVVGATFLAYLFTIYGIQHIGASITGTYIYSQPVFATIIAIIFLGEEFNWEKGVAALLIFGGVYLVNVKSKTAEVKPANL